jgi:hypothetical protein
MTSRFGNGLRPIRGIADLAQDRTTQPPEPPVGAPPRDAQRLSDILHVEIAKIQADGEYLKRDLAECRTDMRDIRDRMTRLEVRVDHLPTKGFIVAAVIASLTIIGALITVAPRLQSLVGTAPVSGQTAH